MNSHVKGYLVVYSILNKYTYVKELGGLSPRTAAGVPKRVLSLVRGVKGLLVWTVLTLLRVAREGSAPAVRPLKEMSLRASRMI